MVSSGPHGYLLTHNIAHDERKSFSSGLGVRGLCRENSRQIGLLSRSGSREREELRKCERSSRLLELILKTRSRAASTTVTQLKHSERFERSEAIEPRERIEHLRYDTAHRRADRRIFFPNVKLRARLEGTEAGMTVKKPGICSVSSRDICSTITSTPTGGVIGGSVSAELRSNVIDERFDPL